MEMTENTPMKGYITEEILRKRLTQVYGGLIGPQIFVTVTVCLGAMIFGNILGWGSPLKYDLPTLYQPNKYLTYEEQFVWVICLAPIAAVARAIVGFLNIFNVGPKQAMIYQSPFLIITFTVMAFNYDYNWYCTSQFFNGFFAFGYIYLGEKLLTSTVHRKYLKVSYAAYRTSTLFGILTMNILGPKVDKVLISYYNIGLIVTCTSFLMFLPESPVHLMKSDEGKARSALYFFRGKHSNESDIIKNYVQLKRSQNYRLGLMIRHRVIYRSLLLCTLVEVLNVFTGYYAFLLDSANMFTKTRSILSPYLDNVMYTSFVVLMHMITRLLHLTYSVRVRPLLISGGFCISILLFAMGTYDFVKTEIMKLDQTWGVTSVFLFTFTIFYDCGIQSCPDRLIYSYLPFQIYEECRVLMFFARWSFIALLIRVYPTVRLYFGFYSVLWMLSAIITICLVLCCVFLVEIKGKSLLQIQYSMGGNPVGNRGSKRQRIPNPFEQFEVVHFVTGNEENNQQNLNEIV